MAVYCLIFFNKSKTTDVILEKSLIEKKEEGETVNIMYGKERCKGKILKKSSKYVTFINLHRWKATNKYFVLSFIYNLL